jgi:hypothetical protein
MPLFSGQQQQSPAGPPSEALDRLQSGAFTSDLSVDEPVLTAACSAPPGAWAPPGYHAIDAPQVAPALVGAGRPVPRLVTQRFSVARGWLLVVHQAC